MAFAQGVFIQAIILFPYLVSVSFAQSTCYTVAGNVAGSQYRPCNSSADVSPCCNLGDGNELSDICTTGGYCVTTGTYSGLLYMNGCTDQSGKSKECQYSLCPNPSNNWNGTTDKQDHWNVQVCAAGLVCCRSTSDMHANIGCCNDSSKIISNFEMGALIVPSNIFSGNAIITEAESNASTSATGVPASTTCPTTGSSSSSTCQDDKSTVVGASVGAVLGTALLAALSALLWMSSRQRKMKKELDSVSAQRGSSKAQESFQYVDDLSQPIDAQSAMPEAPTDGARSELSAKRPTYELPSRP